MSGSALSIDKMSSPPPRWAGASPTGMAVLATAPAILTFGITVLLFAMLTGFDVQALNRFTTIVMAAVIFSLVGAAAMSSIVAGIITDGSASRSSVNRVIGVGTLYSLLWCAVSAAALYPFLTLSVGLSDTDFAFFAALLFMQTLVWIVTGAYASARLYTHYAAVFSTSYLILFLLTYSLHRMNAAYTIYGYTAGIAILLLDSLVTAQYAFEKRPSRGSVTSQSLLSLMRRNVWGAVFQVIYALAIFLDKIIVWTWMGFRTGAGVVISGPYTVGAFLGLVPLFSLGVAIHFEARAAPMVKAMYQGRLSDIQRTAAAYKMLYRRDMAIMLLLGFLFLVITAIFAGYFFGSESETMQVLLTAGMGTIAFTTIVFNYMLLSLFGKSFISTISILTVCILESASIPFLQYNVWYAALGFLLGSVVGSYISTVAVLRTLRSFEFNIFHHATMSSMKQMREESIASLKERGKNGKNLSNRR